MPTLTSERASARPGAPGSRGRGQSLRWWPLAGSLTKQSSFGGAASLPDGCQLPLPDWFPVGMYMKADDGSLSTEHWSMNFILKKDVYKMFIYKIPNKYLRYKCKNQGTTKAFSSFIFFLKRNYSQFCVSWEELKGKLLKRHLPPADH